MAELQDWFAPLLWIMGTVASLVAFVRLFKPLWNLVNSPKELMQKLDENGKKDIEHFEILSKQIDAHEKALNILSEDLEGIHQKLTKTDEIQMSLLHDNIVQIYQRAQDQGEMSEGDYRRICDLYAQDGNSQYIDGIMAKAKAIHEKSLAAR